MLDQFPLLKAFLRVSQTHSSLETSHQEELQEPSTAGNRRRDLQDGLFFAKRHKIDEGVDKIY